MSVVSHGLAKSGFRRSPSRAVYAGTCAACVRMLAPRGRPRECVVEELFIEIHAPPSVGVHGSSEVCRVWTTCSRWRACGRISCAHVLRTLAPNGSLCTRLGAEIDTGLPQHTRVRCDTQVGQLCVFSLTFARCVRKHVRHVRAHAGASRQVERCRG